MRVYPNLLQDPINHEAVAKEITDSFEAEE
jgi:hypothetical protein